MSHRSTTFSCVVLLLALCVWALGTTAQQTRLERREAVLRDHVRRLSRDAHQVMKWQYENSRALQRALVKARRERYREEYE
jgi:hypothetical protein